MRITPETERVVEKLTPYHRERWFSGAFSLEECVLMNLEALGGGDFEPAKHLLRAWSDLHSTQPQTITVTIDAGLVTEIEGLRPGQVVVVNDFDINGASDDDIVEIDNPYSEGKVQVYQAVFTANS